MPQSSPKLPGPPSKERDPNYEPPIRIAPTDPWRCYKCGAGPEKLCLYGRRVRLEYVRCSKCGQRHARKMLPGVVKSNPEREIADQVIREPINMLLSKVTPAKTSTPEPLNPEPEDTGIGR